MGGGTFFKVGGTSARQKIIENFCGLNWQLCSPVATGGFGWLSPPNKAPSTPKLKRETL